MASLQQTSAIVCAFLPPLCSASRQAAAWSGLFWYTTRRDHGVCRTDPGAWSSQTRPRTGRELLVLPPGIKRRASRNPFQAKPRVYRHYMLCAQVALQVGTSDRSTEHETHRNRQFVLAVVPLVARTLEPLAHLKRNETLPR